MRRSALVLLALLVLVASNPASGKSGFSGNYTVKGTNPGVGAYSGVLTIAARGDAYDVYWNIANTQYVGVGLASGDTISVAYTGGDKTWIGIATYHQRADGTLDGRWTVGGVGKVGTETAVRK